MSEKQFDLVEAIPSPDKIRDEIAKAVRRKDLLRGLLLVAIRKQSHDRRKPIVGEEDKSCES